MNHIYKVLYRQTNGEFRTDTFTTGELSVNDAKSQLSSAGHYVIGHAFICEKKDAGCNCQHLQKPGTYWTKPIEFDFDGQKKWSRIS